MTSSAFYKHAFCHAQKQTPNRIRAAFDILTSSRLAPSIEPFICASFSPISDTFGDLLRMRRHEHRRKSNLLTETELNLAVEQSLSVQRLQ